MRKKVCVILAVTVGVLTAAVLTTGILMAMHYRTGFGYETWVNGVYCTGRDVVSVDQELSAADLDRRITITGLNGRKYELHIDRSMYRVSYADGLKDIWENPEYKWYQFWTARKTEYRIEPGVSYDEQAVEELIRNIPLLTEARDYQGERVEIYRDEDGFHLKDDTYDILNVRSAERVILEAVRTGQEEVDLVAARCYRDRQKYPKEQRLLDLYDRLVEFQNFHSIYVMGDERVVIDPGLVSTWVLTDGNGYVTDEEGNPVLSEKAVSDFVDSLAERYDTYGRARVFQSTSRGEVTVPEGGTYGNEINREAETSYLIRALRERIEEEHEPEYIHKALYQGTDDIGNSYVEVDITEQTLYLYSEGELVLSTPIVTGNLKWNLGTPALTCAVYGKRRNAVLRGAGYDSPVKYWAPVYKNIGLHDAAWRKESSFGGETYLKNGSHGCINIPPSVMPEVYEHIFVGMPVIIYE